MRSFDRTDELDSAANKGTQSIGASSGRKLVGYSVVMLLLLLWLAITLYGNSVYAPQMWWFSYFSVDYSSGFVRRGLAGEILGLFPMDRYFVGVWTLRWLVSGIFIAALASVAWIVAVKSGRSERRLMLALLVLVLPFGIGAAISAPQTDLLAGAALALFAVVLSSVKERRMLLLASVCYGITVAVLTLIHEASPLLYSLGAIVAIVVLSVESPIADQRLGALLAVTPGLGAAAAVALLGQRGVSSQLCALVPHRPLNWPAAGGLSSREILNGQRFYLDYHDWVCRNVISKMDQAPVDAARYVLGFGAAALVSSMALGIFVFAMTVFVIGSVSGVPFARLCNLLRVRLSWVVIAAMLLLPLFVTSSDWTRWWVRITFDFCVVYLLYVSSQPEVDQAPTRRTRTAFSVGIVLFALVPFGSIVAIGMATPV